MGDLPEETRDEFVWERFLQDQDRKTERYMELMERHRDDPDRDRIIAREMGWHRLLDRDGGRWVEGLDALDPLEEELGEIERGELPGLACHPLCHAAFELTGWAGRFLQESGGVSELPAAERLVTQLAMVSAKIGAALGQDDLDEIGMTIAYLKRALRGVNLALEAGVELVRAGGLERGEELEGRLFEVRDGIVERMGFYRAEWRRRNPGA